MDRSAGGRSQSALQPFEPPLQPGAILSQFLADPALFFDQVDRGDEARLVQFADLRAQLALDRHG